MSLPTVIAAGQGGHIPDHQEVHRLLDPLSDDGVFLPSGYRQGTLADRPAAAGRKGWFYRATDQPHTYYSDGAAWVEHFTFTTPNTFDDDVYFRSGRPWSSVLAEGADPTGVAASDVAITAAFGNLTQPTGANVTAGGVNGAFDTGGGGIVWFDWGIYSTTATINVPAYVQIVGAHWRGTYIRRTTATATPVLTCTDSRWLVIRDISIESLTNTVGQHLISLVRTGTFGIKCVMERLGLFKGDSGIDFDGDSTGSSFKDIYARGQINSLRQRSGSLSTCRFEQIYCSNPTERGIYFATGGGNCTFDDIITESTSLDGMYLNGFSRNHFGSLYIGDSVASTAGYGIDLHACTGNDFGSIFYDGGALASAAIRFDTSGGNRIGVLLVEGGMSEGVIRIPNDTPGATFDAFSHQPNHIERLINLNDAKTLISAQSGGLLHRVSIGSSIGQPDGNYGESVPFYQARETADEWTVYQADADDQSAVLYPDNDGNGKERWSFLRNYPGAANHGLFGRGQDPTIGVLPVSQSFGNSYLTGDDSTFSAGIGAWVAEDLAGVGTTFTSVAGGMAGNAGKLVIPSGVNGRARYNAAVAANREYLLTFGIKNLGGTGDGKVYVIVDDGVTNLRQTVRLSSFVGSFALFQMRFFCTTTLIRILFTQSGANGGAGSNEFLIDTVLLKDVFATRSIKVAGGRSLGTGVGQGSGIEAHGNDAAGALAGRMDVVAAGGFAPQATWSEFDEIADPAAPAANKGRLYVRDNGAGKTQLVARFPTGAIQVIATEP